MLVEYRNEIYRRKDRLGLSFCDRCPLKYYATDPCYIGRMPYTCPLTGIVTLDVAEIFNL